MARARNIKPSIFRNEILGTLDPLVTILFTSLWCLADRDGKMEDRPLRIKADTFPYRENVDINRYLTELAQHGFIRRYSVNGVAIIQVIKFKEHQSPHKTERDSVLPDFDSQAIENKQEYLLTDIAPLKDDGLTAALPPESISLNPDSLNHECGKRKGAPPCDAVSVLPDWINPDIWKAYLDMRKTIKKPMTEYAKKLAIGKLDGYRKKGIDIDAVINQSVLQNWTDLYEPKPMQQKHGHINKQEALEASNRAVVERLLAKEAQYAQQ